VPSIGDRSSPPRDQSTAATPERGCAACLHPPLSVAGGLRPGRGCTGSTTISWTTAST
jgi:hypothetical protein